MAYGQVNHSCDITDNLDYDFKMMKMKLFRISKFKCV